MLCVVALACLPHWMSGAASPLIPIILGVSVLTKAEHGSIDKSDFILVTQISGDKLYEGEQLRSHKHSPEQL